MTDYLIWAALLLAGGIVGWVLATPRKPEVGPEQSGVGFVSYDFPTPRVITPSDGYSAFLDMLSPHRWTIIGQWFPGGANFLPSIYPDDVILAADKNDAIVMHRHDAAVITIEARIMGPVMRRFVERK